MVTALSQDEFASVILCGGRGTRMGELTASLPKPLLEVHGKPIIGHVLDALLKNRITSFIFPLGFKGWEIADFVEQNYSLRAKLFFIDTGSDSEIKRRIDLTRPCLSHFEDILLVNSDTIFDFNIPEMYKKHRSDSNLVTLCSVDITSPWGLINQSLDGTLVSFERDRKVGLFKTHFDDSVNSLINSGITWFKTRSLDNIDMKNKKDFETDLFNDAIERGRAGVYRMNGFWYPIDTPKDLYAINCSDLSSFHKKSDR